MRSMVHVTAVAILAGIAPLAVYSLAGCVLLAAAQAQEATLHDGQPALIFHADPNLTITVDLVDHDGERALRFPVKHSHFSDCNGYLYLSQNHIAYDPVLTPKFAKDAFDLDRKEVKKAEVALDALTHDHLMAMWSANKRYLFYALFDSGSGKQFSGKESAAPVYQFIGRSLSDFANTLQEAEKQTAGLAGQPQETPEGSSENGGAADAGTVTKNFQLATYGSQETISIPITQPGQLKMSANWGATADNLAIMLNGPGQVTYARNDGPSPLHLEYVIRPDDVAKGSNWNVSIVNFNKDKRFSGVLSVVGPVQEQSASTEAPPEAIPPPPPPSDAPQAPPKTLELGQTKDLVVANFGQPQKVVKLGAKEIYYYPDMKVTFVHGKVTDVQ